MPRVTFSPFGVTAVVTPGTTVLAAADSVGITIHAMCGGRETCGKCAVRVLEGDPGPGDALMPDAIRLACAFRPSGDVVVRPVSATWASGQGHHG